MACGGDKSDQHIIPVAVIRSDNAGTLLGLGQGGGAVTRAAAFSPENLARRSL